MLGPSSLLIRRSAVKVLALDPGETTGFVQAVVEEFGDTIYVQIEEMGQWGNKTTLSEHLGLFKVDEIVIEDYIIYPNRVRSHIGDRVLTARVIGMIEWIAFYHYNLGLNYQMASQAKQRWPNSRIDSYLSPLRHRTITSVHVKDALRHLLTFIEIRLGTEKTIHVRPYG